jgi:hypothetical protein
MSDTWITSCETLRKKENPFFAACKFWLKAMAFQKLLSPRYISGAKMFLPLIEHRPNHAYLMEDFLKHNRTQYSMDVIVSFMLRPLLSVSQTAIFYLYEGVGLRPLAFWDCRFESCRGGHGCFSVVSVVCCQTEVSATSWSLVQRSPTDCVASLCVI